MQTEWQDKSALVTGAGTGIGRAVSRELARRGAVVYVSALTEQEAQVVVDAIASEGGRAHALELDVTDNAAYLAAIRQGYRARGWDEAILDFAASP